ILEDKLVLVDDDGEPLKKVNYLQKVMIRLNLLKMKLQIYWHQRELDMVQKSCGNNGGVAKESGENWKSMTDEEDTAYLCLHSPKDHEGNKINTPYPEKTNTSYSSYRRMDDLNITIEEYARLEEEKARKRRKVFNWKTAKYGKIWDLYVSFGISFNSKWYYKDGDFTRVLRRPRRSMTWRQFILALGLHTTEEMAEERFRAYWSGRERVIPDKGDLSDYLVEISSGRDFLRGAPSYTYIIDLVWRLCHKLISYNISGRGQVPKKVTATDLFYLRSMDRGATNFPYLLAQYYFRHIKGRNKGARLSGGHFIGHLSHHFGLVINDGLRGLSVITRNIPLIDMVNEDALADPTPMQAPQPPPPPPTIALELMLLKTSRIYSKGLLPLVKDLLLLMRIEQYFLMTDYSLWEVILNGDSPILTRVIDGVVMHVASTTAEQRLARKNELKARVIEKWFGGNKETKKVQKTLLKQQYENFTDLSSENLEDQSLDDLFNSLKIYEAEVKSSSSTSPTKQNIAFVSSQNSDSTNESVSAIAIVSAASAKVHVSALPNVDTLSDAQVDTDDLEEMDLKWQMAMLTMRAKGFLQRTGKNLRANGTTSIGFDMSKVEWYNCHRRGHFARECSMMVLEAMTYAFMHKKNQPTMPSWHSPPQVLSVLILRKSQFDVISYKIGLESVEARILVYQQNETVFEEDIKLLKLDVQLSDNALVDLRKKFEKAEQERDELKLKLDKFQTSSKNLSQLLASQTNDKTRLGYDNQVFNSSTFDCDKMFSSESDVSMPACLVYDRYQSREGYHAVPPPYTGTFMPPKLDLVFHDAPTVNETIPIAFNVKLSPTKPDIVLSQSNRPTAPIIEDWVFDSEDEYQVITAVPYNKVIRPRPAKTISTKPHSPPRRTINHRPLPPASNFPPKVTTVKASKGNPQHALKDKGVIDSGCSRHMTGNMSYISDFEEINGGYVAFSGNPKGGKITGKGKIRTGKLDFDDVYFVKELKFNLFSVSQIYDKKNSVLFTDTECIVLSLDFKLHDENHVLLRVPKENNMYNVDLKNIVPSGDLTCLFAKFYGMKGIKREFSVPRTPQQNGIDERKNRNLVEAARTMLADSLLPIPFWAEAVNTACYVQNRLLVTKPHNKTPYELLLGRTPNIGFMRPFGCPVTILNTLDPLGKFDRKADEGFLVGYSESSKAFRVFNSRNRIVQETLHINFLENKPNVAGSRPTWLFDIDTLIKSMNYQPVTAGNQPNPSAYPHNTDDDATFEVKEPEFEVEKPESEVHISPSSSAKTKKHDDKTKREAKGKSPVDLLTGFRNLNEEFEDFSKNSINEVNSASTPVPVVGAEADFSNLETNITVSHILTTRVHKDHYVTQIIGDLSLATQTRSMTRMVKDQGFEDPDYPDKVYEVVKALYGLHQAPRAWYETLANDLLENDLYKAFEKLMKDKFQMSSMGEITFFLGLQLKQKPHGIFMSQDKYVAKILRKFGLTDGKSARTLIDIEKPF
nr:retrovirus-related Pol polyprotein from transposon TNT 1-94 [Tanacetum cinerariifolium]